jgi:hypothetical protein
MCVTANTVCCAQMGRSRIKNTQTREGEHAKGGGGGSPRALSIHITGALLMRSDIVFRLC